MKTARPILFSGAMVRALLREAEKPGTGKTQTRRIVKPQPEPRADFPGGLEWKGMLVQPTGKRGEHMDFYCPYGKPGDLLWVRETWCHFAMNARDGMGEMTYYRADQGNTTAKSQEVMARNGVTWKPSIHMPRAYSRLTLELTDVRIERLHDISEEDALAEGITKDYIITDVVCYGGPPIEKHEHRYFTGLESDPEIGYESAGEAFAALWVAINGQESWDANPWVWALTFKVHKMNVDDYLGRRGDV